MPESTYWHKRTLYTNFRRNKNSGVKPWSICQWDPSGGIRVQLPRFTSAQRKSRFSMLVFFFGYILCKLMKSDRKRLVGNAEVRGAVYHDVRGAVLSKIR